MSMQLKNISIIAASALIVSGSIYAAPPTAYDNWAIEGGVIYSGKKDDGWLGSSPLTGPAPEALDGYTPIYTPPTAAPLTTPVSGNFSCDDSNITCKVLVQEDGFIYEQITYTSPNPLYPNRTREYLRMIVVDDTVVNGNSSTVSFSSESFVPFGIAGEAVDQGLAVKQVVRDSQDNFVDVAEIQKGFLRLDPDVRVEPSSPGSATILPSPLTPVEETFTTKLLQTFNTGDIDSSFSYTNYTAFETGPVASNPDTGNIIGQKTGLSQTVFLGDNATITDPSNKARQAFEYRQTKGYMGTTISPFGSAYFIAASPLTVAGTMDLEKFTQTDPNNNYGGSPIGWNNGEDVRVTWIAATDLVDFGETTPITGLGIGDPCPATQPTCTIVNGAPHIPTPNGIGFAYQEVSNVNDGTKARERFLNFVDGDWTLPADPLTADPFDWDNNFGSQPVF